MTVETDLSRSKIERAFHQPRKGPCAPQLVIHRQTDYEGVTLFRVLLAVLNTLLIELPSVPMTATAAKAIRTRSNAYSVRSWPSSSCQSLLNTSIISFILLFSRKGPLHSSTGDRSSCPLRRCCTAQIISCFAEHIVD